MLLQIWMCEVSKSTMVLIFTETYVTHIHYLQIVITKMKTEHVCKFIFRLSTFWYPNNRYLKIFCSVVFLY